MGDAMQRWWALARRVCTVAWACAGAACGDAAPYRIGIVLGSEGALAATLAADSLNAARGAHDRRVELRILPHAYGTSAEIALEGADSLALDGSVVAVVGHSNSSASLAASQIYNARHVVQIAPTTTSPQYSQAGPYSYRLVASDAHQARFLVDQVGTPAGRIAVVYVNDDYGRSLRQLVDEALTARGITPAYQVPYAESEKDGTDVVNALVNARPATLLWLGRDDLFARIADSLRARLPHLAVLATDGFGSVSVQRNIFPQLAGVRYVRLVNVDGVAPALRALDARYRRAGGQALTDQAILTYDAVMLLGTAVREAGTDREAIRQWLDALGRARPAYVGVSGPISFSPDGDRSPSYVLVTAGAPPSVPATPRQ